MTKPCPVCKGLRTGTICFRCGGKGTIEVRVHSCTPDEPGFCPSCQRERADQEADFAAQLLEGYQNQQYDP